MRQIFNRQHQKQTRQYLRTHGTRAEMLLWNALKGRQLEGSKFRRQQGILDFVVDLYCPELQLVIEVDGVSHDSDEARSKDARRERAIASLGIIVHRIRDEAVNENIDSVVEDLRALVRKLKAGI